LTTSRFEKKKNFDERYFKSLSQGLVSKKDKLFIGSTENILNPRKNLIILFDFINKNIKFIAFLVVFFFSERRISEWK